ncbi:MAG: aspartate kinase [Phototrophicaceae bacterium]
MTTLVMKFGGSAVGTVSALTQVLSITIHEFKRWDRLLIVASALDGVTDMLLEAAHLAQVSNQRGYRRIAATLRTRHLALAEQLPLGIQERNALNADIDRLLFEMLDDCQTVASIPSDTLSPEISDRIIGVGEKLAARIIAALLRNNDLRGVAIDGTDVIVTNDVHGNATPLFDPTRERIEANLLPMIDRKIIPVLTGFIGATIDGKPTTMGRGGSDFTASVLASCISADEVWVWSDVDGMMSTDPREISNAVAISEMSYNEVAELAYFGARILHARMVSPLQERDIPLHIKNVYKPQKSGTVIHSARKTSSENIIAVTTIPGISLTAKRSGSLTKISQIIDETLIKTTGNESDVMFTSQSATQSFMCFIVPIHAGGVEAVSTITSRLQRKIGESQESVTWRIEQVTLVTAIGESFGKHTGLESTVLQALEGIPMIGLIQGASNCSLSVIVNPDDADLVLEKIHNLILS